MRLKRMCEKTPGTGRLAVSEEVAQQWQSGDRTQLTLALCQALKVHGFENNNATRKAVRAGVVSKVGRLT